MKNRHILEEENDNQTTGTTGGTASEETAKVPAPDAGAEEEAAGAEGEAA